MMKLVYYFNLIMWISLYSIIISMMLNFFSPIIIIILLVIYNTLICLNMGLWSTNYLYAIMLFLIMISGMLIIFMYFSSIISNEQMKFNMNLAPLFLLSIPLMITIYFYYFKPYNSLHYMYNSKELTMSFNFHLHIFNNVMNMYNYPFNNLSLLCMIYLLLTLIMIIKICTLNYSPLRKLMMYV